MLECAIAAPVYAAALSEARAVTFRPAPTSMLASAHVTRLRAGAEPVSERDTLVAEEPLELRLGGEPLSVTLRTPGHDEELALGFLWTMRLIRSLEDVVAIRAGLGPVGARVVEIELSPHAPERRAWVQRFAATASCGLCGTERLDMLVVHAPVTGRPDAPRLARAVLHALPARMRATQVAFAATGGLHAAALFTAGGELLAVREDVGRHNALDKLAGWMLRQPCVDAAESIVMLSGRLSYELVAKTLALGVPVLAAVGAPSSLAVETALQHGMTLAGFVRDTSATIYAGEQRLDA